MKYLKPVETCRVCGQEFKPTSNASAICSDKCRSDSVRAAKRAWRRKNKTRKPNLPKPEFTEKERVVRVLEKLLALLKGIGDEN